MLHLLQQHAFPGQFTLTTNSPDAAYGLHKLRCSPAGGALHLLHAPPTPPPAPAAGSPPRPRPTSAAALSLTAVAQAVHRSPLPGRLALTDPAVAAPPSAAAVLPQPAASAGAALLHAAYGIGSGGAAAQGSRPAQEDVASAYAAVSSHTSPPATSEAPGELAGYEEDAPPAAPAGRAWLSLQWQQLCVRAAVAEERLASVDVALRSLCARREVEAHAAVPGGAVGEQGLQDEVCSFCFGSEASCRHQASSRLC